MNETEGTEKKAQDAKDQPLLVTPNPQQVFILRGMTGAGKSSAAARLKALIGESAVVKHLSTDDYWLRDGHYQFNPAELGRAHLWCLHSYVSYLAAPTHASKELVIVDNTNINAWEAAPYVAMASVYGWDCSIVSFLVDPVVCITRSIHNVPFSAMMGMAKGMMLESLPGHWRQLHGVQAEAIVRDWAMDIKPFGTIE